MLVSGIVVENDVHALFGRNLCFNSIEEADEFLVTMALRERG
jgi:hypothetical protein